MNEVDFSVQIPSDFLSFIAKKRTKLNPGKVGEKERNLFSHRKSEIPKM